MKTYTIIGATGHTGTPIALGLLAKGQTVRFITRDVNKGKDLIEKGGKPVHTSLTDVEGLKKAFTGADAVYVMIPGDLQGKDAAAHQMAVTDAVAQALKDAGVKYAVTLSSIGAHLKHGAGIVQGLQKMEERLNEIPGINILHLRAAYFLENTLNMAGMVKHMGLLGTPTRGDVKIPMVATKDIGEVALHHLLKLDFSGKSHVYVLGKHDYTYEEITAIFGKVIGKPDLKYAQFPFDQAKEAMMQMGLGESYVDLLNEFVKAMNNGSALNDYKRDKSNTTPTSAEEFSLAFKAVYDKI
jgi:uncharacterized protein YbjT (DUF2867 family)